MKTHILLARVLACAALVLVAPGYSSEKIPVTGSGFVAKDDSLRTFFDAMALQLKEPVIVSKMAARKKITGNFEFHDPNALLEKLSLQLGLIGISMGRLSIFMTPVKCAMPWFLYATSHSMSSTIF